MTRFFSCSPILVRTACTTFYLLSTTRTSSSASPLTLRPAASSALTLISSPPGNSSKDSTDSSCASSRDPTTAVQICTLLLDRSLLPNFALECLLCVFHYTWTYIRYATVTISDTSRAFIRGFLRAVVKEQLHSMTSTVRIDHMSTTLICIFQVYFHLNLLLYAMNNQLVKLINIFAGSSADFCSRIERFSTVKFFNCAGSR